MEYTRKLVELEFEDWPELLTPGEVAGLFGVDPKTVTRWVGAGRINSIRTPGNQHRFPRESTRDAWRAQFGKG